MAMKQDVFIEKIVKRRKTGKDMLLIGLILTIIPIAFLASLIIGLEFGMLLFAGSIYLVYRLITGMNVEYEYILTNDDISIDKIIARRRRKRMYNGSCKNFTIIAPVSDRAFDTNRKNDRVKLLDFSSGSDPKTQWFFTTKSNDKQILVVFEPDDRYLQTFRRFNPRAMMNAGMTVTS